MSQQIEMSMDGPDEVMPRPPSLRRRRGLVLAFYLNFCFSLLSIVLTGSLFDTVRQTLLSWLGVSYYPVVTVINGPGTRVAAQTIVNASRFPVSPSVNGWVINNPGSPAWSTSVIWLMDMARLYPLLFLLVPLISLIALYIALRYQARDTMLGSERYLDERQKMVRDWAQRSAYRVIKWVLLLAAVGLVLHGVFPGSPEPLNGQGNTLSLLWSPQSPLAMQVHAITFFSSSTNWPIDPLHVLLYYGTLLACIFLLLTVLPISIVLWKKDPSRAAAGLK